MYDIIPQYCISKYISKHSILRIELFIYEFISCLYIPGFLWYLIRNQQFYFTTIYFSFSQLEFCTYQTFPLKKSGKITIHWIARKAVILSYTHQWMRCTCIQILSNMPVDGADEHPVYTQNFVGLVYVCLWRVLNMAFLISFLPQLKQLLESGIKNPVYLITRIRLRGLNPFWWLMWALVLPFILVEFWNPYVLCVYTSPPLDPFDECLDLKFDEVIQFSSWKKLATYM